MSAALVALAELPAWYPLGGDPAIMRPELGAAWSGPGDPPAIGAEVFVGNQIGAGRVLSYFTEHGYLGLLVMPSDPPIWYAEQNGLDTPCHVFGRELRDGPERGPAAKGRYRRASVLKRWRDKRAEPAR